VQADIIIYAIIAVALVAWLRSILGTRHGDEKESINPFASHTDNADSAVSMPGGPDLGTPSLTIESIKEGLSKSMSVEGEYAEKGIMSIAQASRGFDLAAFLNGAQDAFVIIVEAFAANDRDTLKPLLSDNVYKGFDAVISQREKDEQVSSVEIHAVRKVEVLEAEIKDNIAYISIRFVADETNTLKDKDGELIYGDPDYITETVDIWTFGRDVKSKNPIWYLYETRDEDSSDEDRKTVPDA